MRRLLTRPLVIVLGVVVLLDVGWLGYENIGSCFMPSVALKFDPIRPRVHPSRYVCRTALQISHNYANALARGIHSRMHAF